MLVEEIMRKEFLTVLPSESIQEAAKKMKEKNVGFALVLEDEKFRGILTAQEIQDAIAAKADEILNRGTNPDSANADGDRCCYFSDVMVEMLAGK